MNLFASVAFMEYRQFSHISPDYCGSTGVKPSGAADMLQSPRAMILSSFANFYFQFRRRTFFNTLIMFFSWKNNFQKKIIISVWNGDRSQSERRPIKAFFLLSFTGFIFCQGWMLYILRTRWNYGPVVLAEYFLWIFDKWGNLFYLILLMTTLLSLAGLPMLVSGFFCLLLESIRSKFLSFVF